MADRFVGMSCPKMAEGRVWPPRQYGRGTSSPAAGQSLVGRKRRRSPKCPQAWYYKARLGGRLNGFLFPHVGHKEPSMAHTETHMHRYTQRDIQTQKLFF